MFLYFLTVFLVMCEGEFVRKPENCTFTEDFSEVVLASYKGGLQVAAVFGKGVLSGVFIQLVARAF